MPNYALAERNKVLAAYPGAILDAQGRNWMRHSIAPNQFALDCAIGSYHHLNGGVWQDTVTDIVNSDLPGYAHMVNVAPFIVHCKADGSRRLYPRRDVLTEYIEFGRIQWRTGGSVWQDVTLPDLTRSGETLTGETTNFGLTLRLTPDQVKVSVTLKTSTAARPLRWQVSLVGLTLDWPNRQLVSQGDGAIVAALTEPRIVADATGFLREPRPVTPSYSGGFLRFDADLTGLVFPITIDPTIDTQVAASNLDAYELDSGGSFSYTNSFSYLQANTSDFNRINLGNIFTLTGPASGATVNVAYATIYSHGRGGVGEDPECDIYCEDVDDAATFQATQDVTSRVRTAGVSWSATGIGIDVWVNTPSLVTPVQAVINRAGWASGQKLDVLFISKNNATGKTCGVESYDFDTTLAVKFHLEYTAGGAVYVPRSGVVNFVDPGVF